MNTLSPLSLAASMFVNARRALAGRGPEPRASLGARAARAGAVAALLLAAGCGGAPIEAGPLPASSPAIAAEVETRGQTVYFGRVFPLKSDAKTPTFVYERRVDERDGALVATHITRDPEGRIALAESAKHTADYALTEYTLHRNQVGQTGTVRVENGEVRFQLLDGTRARTGVERQAGAVVVGPTLVGYLVRHLPALRAGEALSVRMAVLDRLETIGFDLSAVAAGPGQTRVKMKASSFPYSMVIDPVHFTFEAATDKLVRIEGRVPPKVWSKGSWRDFDARVDYQFVSASYR